ncbi:hypothetical protein [Streptomyces sp. NPDC060198]|uniref:hypothetical protein n=1 Tax=Streptomyces sp. NPDC060198 TaxID=3347070 RepID=UPI003648E6A9
MDDTKTPAYHAIAAHAAAARALIEELEQISRDLYEQHAAGQYACMDGTLALDAQVLSVRDYLRRARVRAAFLTDDLSYARAAAAGLTLRTTTSTAGE